MILRGVSLFGLAQVAALVAGLVLQAVVARALAVGDYGRFVVAHSVSVAALMLLMSAVPNALRRLVSVDCGNLRSAWRAVWLVQLPISVLFAVILCCLAPLVARAMNDLLLTPALVIIAAELGVKAGLLEPGWHLLNGLGRHMLQACLMTGHSMLRVVCVICVLQVSVGLVESVAGLLLSAAVSATIAVPIVQRLAKNMPGDPYGGLGRELLRWAKLAPGVDALNYLLVAANLWMLKAMTVDPSLVGTYAACYMLTQTILPFSLVLSRGCFASFAGAVSKDEMQDASRLLSQVARLAALATGWGGVLAILHGEAIVSLVYGVRFAAPGMLLALLGLGMAGMGMLWFFCEMLGAAGRLKDRLGLMMGVSAASIAVTALLARTWGPWGAGWALVITGSSGTLAASVLLRSLVGAFLPWRTLFRAAVAAATIILVGRLGHPVFQEAAALLSGLAVSLGYFGLLALLGEWDLTEWRSVRRRWCDLRGSVENRLPKGERHE